MTGTIIDIAAPLGIAVHDHIIVGKNGHASLRGVEADLTRQNRGHANIGGSQVANR